MQTIRCIIAEDIFVVASVRTRNLTCVFLFFLPIPLPPLSHYNPQYLYWSVPKSQILVRNIVGYRNRDMQVLLRSHKNLTAQ
jgi:hypothetical protein